MREAFIRQHAAQALTRSVSPETRRHLRAILDEIDPGRPTALSRCPVCGATGLAERIEQHDCRGGLEPREPAAASEGGME